MKLRNMTSLYITDGSRILMLYRESSRVGPDSWRGIGGHFESYELNDPRACVLRELREEAGLQPWDLSNLRLRYITLRTVNGEIRQNYYYFADIAPGVKVPEKSPEGRLEWTDYRSMWRMPMPNSSRSVLRHYFSEGKYNDRVYCGVFGDSGMRFTALSSMK